MPPTVHHRCVEDAYVVSAAENGLADTLAPKSLHAAGTHPVVQLQGEHGALLRRIAGLQRRVSDQMQAYARQVAGLEAELLRLRGQLVTASTSVYWGLANAGLPRFLAPGAARGHAGLCAATPPMKEASHVICLTGCAGHAHPWLNAEGQCLRTGQPCDQQTHMDDTIQASALDAGAGAGGVNPSQP